MRTKFILCTPPLSMPYANIAFAETNIIVRVSIVLAKKMCKIWNFLFSLWTFPYLCF